MPCFTFLFKEELSKLAQLQILIILKHSLFLSVSQRISLNISYFKLTTVPEHAWAIPVTCLERKKKKRTKKTSSWLSPAFRGWSMTAKTAWAPRRLQKKKTSYDWRGQRRRCSKAVKKLATTEQNLPDWDNVYSTSLFLEGSF